MALDTFNVAIVNHDSFMLSKSPTIYIVSKWQQSGKKAHVLIHLFNFLGPIMWLDYVFGTIGMSGKLIMVSKKFEG